MNGLQQQSKLLKKKFFKYRYNKNQACLEKKEDSYKKLRLIRKN